MKDPMIEVIDLRRTFKEIEAVRRRGPQTGFSGV
jgi:hypothetical protein